LNTLLLLPVVAVVGMAVEEARVALDRRLDMQLLPEVQ
jgi:hypothetical protein